MYTSAIPTDDRLLVVNSDTVVLAEKLGDCINAMIGSGCSVEKKSYKNERHAYEGIVVFVPFFGTIQGYYIMSSEEKAAGKLLCRLHAADPESTNAENIEYSIEFYKEVLNTAVGQAIENLENEYGYLSYFAPVAVIGRIEFPALLSGSMDIITPDGVITCGLMLDLVKPRIAQKLTTTLHDLQQKTKEAVTDGLTKAYNRAFFEDFLRKAINESKLGNNRIGLIMVDVDHFKKLNDQFGHQWGDFILQTIATIFHTVLSETDIAARYGGDEFIIALPHRTQAECVVMAERIRSSVRELSTRCTHPSTMPQPEVTVSIGVTYLLPDDSFEEFVSRADKLLYSAKRAGRNTFVCG